MGFTLLDRPNPNGPHYYETRVQPLLAIVVHVTAGAEDLDTLNDLSAENVAAYAGSTDRDVSWHTGSDTDSWVNLLPSTFTAWHASSYNSCTHGHEISKRTTDWRVMSETWIAKTLRMAALGPNGNGGLRSIALQYGIPFRKASRAELDAQRANYLADRPWRPVGFISHAEVQPADRTDPGWVSGVDTFPWARFMALLSMEDDVSAADVWKTKVPSAYNPDYEIEAGAWLTTNAGKLERIEVKIDAMNGTLSERHAELVAAVREGQDEDTPTDYDRLGKAIAENLPAPTGGMSADEFREELAALFDRAYQRLDSDTGSTE